MHCTNFCFMIGFGMSVTQPFHLFTLTFPRKSYSSTDEMCRGLFTQPTLLVRFSGVGTSSGGREGDQARHYPAQAEVLMLTS